MEAKSTLQGDFEAKAQRIHVISQLLKAYALYLKDVQYVVQENKVIIVDENTGRLMTGRRWSDGLHQAVEAKEGVAIERETQTLATITIQNYFRLYQKLAGMTGTAETEAGEFLDIYKLGVLSVPTNRPVQRKDANDSVYKTKREKYNAVIREIKDVHVKGRPILVGTVSIEDNEIEEERRLAYVGMTRAKERLTLTHAMRRSLYGRADSNLPSRFLDELPSEVERERLRPASWSQYGAPRPQEVAPRSDLPDLSTGDSVRHSTLGEGVVTRIEPGNVVTVRFGDGSERRLMLEYAPLERI